MIERGEAVGPPRIPVSQRHDRVARALRRLSGLLDSANTLPTEYVLFGSAVLYLHGLRKPCTVGDVDVFVRRRIYEKWRARSDGKECVPRADDPPFFEFPGDPPIHAFYEWTDRDRIWMNVERCFDVAEYRGGWRCISLHELREHKRLANSQEPPDVRAKHLADLRLLNEVLG